VHNTQSDRISRRCREDDVIVFGNSSRFSAFKYSNWVYHRRLHDKTKTLIIVRGKNTAALTYETSRLFDVYFMRELRSKYNNIIIPIQ